MRHPARSFRHALATSLAVAAFALLTLVSGARLAMAQTIAPAPSVEDAEDIRSGQLKYDPEGRRDPFAPLTGEAPAEEERSKYKDSLRGLLWDQAKLTAIIRTPGGPIAMFEGGAQKMGFPASEGDRFWNAVVYRIDYEAATVTVREELDDPRLLKPYRDHPIPLHPNEGMDTGSAGGRMR